MMRKAQYIATPHAANSAIFTKVSQILEVG
jgi:hypothetical protein